MAKHKRDLETNRKIVITTITFLIIFVVILTIVPAVLIYIKLNNESTINQISNEIEQYIIDIDSIDRQIQTNKEALDEAKDPNKYTKNIQDTYPELLKEYESYIKDDKSNEKVCYLIFETTKKTNLDTILSVLSDNNVLSIFFLSSETKEASSKIINDGHFVGMLINNEFKKIDNQEQYIKDFNNEFSSDLYLCQNDFSDEKIENLLQTNNNKKVSYNATSDDKPLLDKQGYVSSIVDTTADRDFITLKINTDNNVGVKALDSLIKELKSKNYVFLPLVSTSTTLD